MAYIHIDDELMPHLELLIDCVKLNGKDIYDTVRKITDDSDLMAKCLEDNFLGFKLHSKKVRDEYETAVRNEIEKANAVWEKCADLIDESRPKIQNITNLMREPVMLLDEINEKLNDLSIWKLEKLIDCIDKFYKMPAEEKELFKRLLHE